MPDQHSSVARHISPAAERMRQSRARRRNGFFTVYVDVHKSDVERMIDLGLLRETEITDVIEIGSAVGAILGDFLGTT